MMNAAESPWQTRPDISNGTANAPDGAIPTSSDPAMPSTNPHIRIFTRPTRSARPPTTTMKMPENSAVMDTAMFMTLVATPRSLAIAGAILRVVCANSQKARTPKMMPKRSLSSPRYEVGSRVMVGHPSVSLSGALFQRSRLVDSRKTGSDQPSLMARLRTPNVTRKPAIIADRRPVPIP